MVPNLQGNRRLTPEALAHLGDGQLVYVKPISVNGEQVVAVHSADGSPLAVAATRDLAIAAARQFEMTPLSVH